MNRQERADLERRLYEFGRTIPPLTDEQRERMKPDFEPKPLAPAFPLRRNWWPGIRFGIYILIPAISLVAYALGLAWCWERYS